MSTNLKLSGAIQYDKDVDNFLAAKIIAMVEQEHSTDIISDRSKHTPELLSRTVETADQPNKFAGRSLIEAFNETNAKIKPYRVVVAGYRAMEESGEESFVSKQIIEQFKSAGISPKNLDRELKKAVKMGLIYTETGDKSKYRVTELALSAFSKGFDAVKISSVRSGSNSRTKRPTTVKLEISDKVTDLSPQVSLEGYPNYHDLNKKSERIIWIVIYAAKHDITALNSKEIEHISKELRDDIPASSISALTNSSIKKGYLARSGSGYRLLHPGDLLIRNGGGDEKA